MKILHDFTCILLSVTEQDVESTVQIVERKGNSINFTTEDILLLKIF